MRSSAAGEPAATHLLMPAWTESASPRRATISARRSSTSFPAIPLAACRPSSGALCAAIGRDRRNACGPRRNAAHPLAHGRRLGARRAPSGARRREAAAYRRRRSARAVPSARPCERPPLRRRLRFGTDRARGRRAASPMRLPRRDLPARAVENLRRRGRGRRRHFLRDARDRAAHRRRMAPERDSISTSSAPSTCTCAKPTTRRLRRARIFVDTEAAWTEGGDVAVGLASGVIGRADIAADLPALCRGAKGRRTGEEITLFKSVGASIEDLAAAILVWRRSGDAEP